MRAEPLGSLLASRGHITQEQLDIALTEQKATGRPLGEIIVARGFAPGPTVAQALATQHGGLLKTEYGFATGWSGQESNGAPVTAPPPPSHDETASLRASLAEHQKALEAWKQSHAKLEERLAQTAQQEAPAASTADDSLVTELEAERDALKAERDGFKAERDAFKVELAESRKPAPTDNDPRLAQLIADRESTQAELAKRDESIEQLKADLANVESGRKELERSLAKEVERGASVQVELEELQNAPAPEPEPAPEPAGRWDAAESHLVFFQGAEGYELVERSGPPPSEGSTVDSRLVARIASAPFPGSALPCAYLVA
jgi:prefoldin subunit 5